MLRQGKGSLNLSLQELPCSFKASYNGKSYNRRSYHDYAPESVWARSKSNIVVGGVIGLCCTTYYCQWTGARQAERGDHALSDLIRQNFISSLQNLKEGRWWVQISSSIAHVNLPHLVLNMVALWGMGRGFVEIYGVYYFAMLWITSASAASWLQTDWQFKQEKLRKEMVGRRGDQPENPRILGIPISRERALAISGGSGSPGVQYGGSAGASGVICGLMGTFVCLAPKTSIIFFLFPMPLWLGSLVFCTGSAFCMATGHLPMIGHAAHLGGFASGLAYYWGALRPWLRKTGRL